MAVLRAMAVAAFVGACALAPTPVVAQDDTSAAEQRIKAAFLHHFGTFVEWPASAFAGPGDSLNIGVIADDETTAYLRELSARRSLQGRPIRVVRVDRDTELDGVHIVFVPRGAMHHLPRIVEVIDGRPVLLVVDSAPGSTTGAVVEFVVVDDRVRFDVDLDAAQRQGLRMSSRMLQVARQVVGAQS